MLVVAAVDQVEQVDQVVVAVVRVVSERLILVAVEQREVLPVCQVVVDLVVILIQVVIPRQDNINF